MANGKTTVIDKGFSRIRVDLDKTDGSTVQVGILKGVSSFIGPIKIGANFGPQPKGNFSVAEIAAVQEFGTNKAGKSKNVVIPERSFLRSTADENKEKYGKVLRSIMGDILLGSIKVEKGLALFGERVVGDVKKKITTIREPANAPGTIAQKGFDNPLIRTGTLRARIAKKVKL